jgi:hypothetical protein
MWNKLKITVATVVLAALAFGGFSVALAASGPANSAPSLAPVAPADVTPAPSTAAATPGTTWAMGQVSAIGTDNFTLNGPLGGLHVVYVNDQTLYFDSDAQAGSFAGMQVGDRVLGAATVVDGKATAKLVIDLGARSQYRGNGVASAVNSSEQSFTFVNRRGVVWDLYVDSNTKITGKQGAALTFADIHSGTRLFVHAEKRADGKWWAVDIRTGKGGKNSARPAATPTTTSNS